MLFSRHLEEAHRARTPHRGSAWHIIAAPPVSAHGTFARLTLTPAAALGISPSCAAPAPRIITLLRGGRESYEAGSLPVTALRKIWAANLAAAHARSKHRGGAWRIWKENMRLVDRHRSDTLPGTTCA